MVQMHWFLVLFFISSVIEKSSCIFGRNVRNAHKDEFPFVVSISFNNSDKKVNPLKNHLCGGALLTPRYVLTAAHCFNTLQHTYQVVVKTNDGNLLKSQIHSVQKWITFYEWSKNKTISKNINDIAIVELREEIGSRRLGRLTCMEETKLYGKTATIAGWGLTNNKRRPQNLLIADNLVVQESQRCRRNWEDDVGNNMEGRIFMCTKADPQVFTEKGDSGSPVMLTRSHEIIAIHKGNYHTITEFQQNYTKNVHISIDYYRDFIDHVINCKEPRCCVQ